MKKKDGKTYTKVGTFKPQETIKRKYSDGTVIAVKYEPYTPVRNNNVFVKPFNN